jgi:GTP-binding protein HflX
MGERLAALSQELERPLSIYLNRRGQVIRVGIGTPYQTQISVTELPRMADERLSGIRCLTTHLQSEVPDQASLTAMRLMRLDALVQLQLSGQGAQRRGGGSRGYIEQAVLAHPWPGTAEGWKIGKPTALEVLTDQDFPLLVAEVERAFQQSDRPAAADHGQEKVLLVGLETQQNRGQAFQEDLVELQRLVETAGGQVIGQIEQRREAPHPQTVVGEGKLAEIALMAQTLVADSVAFNRDLSPAQIRNLEQRIGLRVVDRTEIILDIFAQRARSSAGKLQVELAQLEYQLPRLTGRGRAMSRLGGGIGTRGPGETKLETERRALQRRISRLQREVDELQAQRTLLRQRRQRQALPVIAIVGYTNAGKSTLLNALTQAEIYAADQLFATLDPTTRRLTVLLPEGQRRTLLLTDTVGFIHDLPPALLDAFRATLEEVTDADALVHLVDLSNPAWRSHIAAVETILTDLPLPMGPIALVFNKVDQVDSVTLQAAQESYPEATFISAAADLGLQTLRLRLLKLAEQATQDGGSLLS